MMKGALTKAKQIMRSRKANDSGIKGKTFQETETKTEDDISALELKEFLELESRAKQMFRPEWFSALPQQTYSTIKARKDQVIPPNKKTAQNGLATPEIKQSSPRSKEVGQERERITRNDYEGGRPKLHGYQYMKRSMSTKNIHIGSVIDPRRKYLDDLRKSLAIRSEKQTPIGPLRNLTSRDQSEQVKEDYPKAMTEKNTPLTNSNAQPFTSVGSSKNTQTNFNIKEGYRTQ